ncbi:hypothetical protein C7445_1466 [Alicyclobacillus sacchari]|uniref:Uncharacterized protein n=1 Tax=Alicyclobacillus sacchari TaxID=392010 RepID=A0A4R8L627_9BACL|nr:hypothetical protein C7445_1466 [Alicyclobacillus sacchari]
MFVYDSASWNPQGAFIPYSWSLRPLYLLFLNFLSQHPFYAVLSFLQ